MAVADDTSRETIRVLLLEDNLADMALLEIYLAEIEDRNFDIHWVQTIAAARKTLLAGPDSFDVVFVDHNLPDGNGLDLVGEIGDRIQPPVILLTGNAGRELDHSVMTSGAADFLPKDIIDSKILDRTIRYSMERRVHSQSLKSSVNDLQATNQRMAETTARRDAEAANVIKLAEHLAKPPNRDDSSCHIVETDRSGEKAIAEACTVGVWHIQPDGQSIHANAQMCRLLGFKTEEALTDLDFVSRFAEPDQRRARREVAVWATGLASSFESRFATTEKTEYRDLVISGCPMLDVTGETETIIVTVMDITERRQAETMVRDLAQKDPLTTLLNRAAFMELLPSALAINQRNETQVAVLYIDLDRFKAVNDTYGHQAGDDVLRIFAGKLKSCIRESDFAARLGGDEFTVALNNLKSPHGAASVAGHILEVVREPWVINGELVDLGLSVGIAMSDGCTAEQCLKNADLALYRCKRDGGDRYEYFDANMLEAVESRHRCEADLKDAIKHGGFRLHYQPQIRLTDGETTGFEALIRWERPSFGLVGPGEFMGVAEDTGAIVEIGKWVARTACEQIADLPPDVPVSINISARELRQPDLARNLADILSAAGISPDRLIIEITESAVIDDLEQSALTLAAIRRQGIRVALDDFGTGYSSLSILKRLPVDSIKIDRSFVSNICTNRVDAAIAESIVDLGRRMNLRVVAECIETEEQAECLKNMGCEEAQGFFYSRPVPAESIPYWDSPQPVQAMI